MQSSLPSTPTAVAAAAAAGASRSGSWYNEQIERCRSQLRQQEETLAAIRKSQQWDRAGGSSAAGADPQQEKAQKMHPEMLSPEQTRDTIALMENVLRRSFSRSNALQESDEGGVGSGDSGSGDGDSSSSSSSIDKDETVGVAHGRNSPDVKLNSLRHDVIEIPAVQNRIKKGTL